MFPVGYFIEAIYARNFAAGSGKDEPGGSWPSRFVHRSLPIRATPCPLSSIAKRFTPFCRRLAARWRSTRGARSSRTSARSKSPSSTSWPTRFRPSGNSRSGSATPRCRSASAFWRPTDTSAGSRTGGRRAIRPPTISSSSTARSAKFATENSTASLSRALMLSSPASSRRTFGPMWPTSCSGRRPTRSHRFFSAGAPGSRWKSPKREDIEKVPALEIVADSEEAGPNMLVEAAPYDDGRMAYPKRAYVLNHPEYETETLAIEYRRDSAIDPSWPLPKHYFPDDDPARPPLNRWRHIAQIYTNWVTAVYEATPYDIEDIPHRSTGSAARSGQSTQTAYARRAALFGS